MSKVTLKGILAAFLPDNSQLRASAHRQANEAMVDAFYMPYGMLLPYAGSIVPSYLHVCDGGEVSRNANPNLFADIGISWGEGDGSTTFNVPNIPEGGCPVQYGTNILFGSVDGEIEHELTEDENAEHTHGFRKSNDSNGNLLHIQADTDATIDGDGIKNTVDGQVPIITPSGKGNPHNNMQPYAAMNWVVRLG